MHKKRLNRIYSTPPPSNPPLFYFYFFAIVSKVKTIEVLLTIMDKGLYSPRLSESSKIIPEIMPQFISCC